MENNMKDGSGMEASKNPMFTPAVIGLSIALVIVLIVGVVAVVFQQRTISDLKTSSEDATTDEVDSDTSSTIAGDDEETPDVEDAATNTNSADEPTPAETPVAGDATEDTSAPAADAEEETPATFTTSDISTSDGTKLFIPYLAPASDANSTGKGFSVRLYDTATNKVTAEKRFNTPDPVVIAESIDNYFQFNPQTSDIYYSTESGGLGGCSNADGTCHNRIYRTNFNNHDLHKIVYEDADGDTPFTQQYAVSQNENVIFVLSYETDPAKRAAIVERVDVAAGTANTIATLPSSDTVFYDASRLQVSEDGKSLFIGRREAIANSNAYRLYLDTIDLSTNKITSVKYFEGLLISGLSSAVVSSDGTQIALWAYGDETPARLFVYNVPSGHLSNAPRAGAAVENLNLAWSSDGQKLLFAVKDRVAYYDTVDGENHVIRGSIPSDAHPHVISAPGSKKFFLFTQALDNGAGLEVYNIATGKLNSDLPSTTDIDNVMESQAQWY